MTNTWRAIYHENRRDDIDFNPEPFPILHYVTYRLTAKADGPAG